ncbi:MAG: DUF1080 domain-containing protein [Lentisphaeria bacterium]|nr:DUF1080 domain-containing protein [Lentisphaeria bacterium]
MTVLADNVNDLINKLTWAEPAAGKAIVQQLQQGGEETLRALAAMLKEGNDEGTVQASFAIEALVMHAMRPGADAERHALAATLAKLLPTAADDVARGVLLKALQLVGGPAEVPAIAAALSSERAADYAILALVQIGDDGAKAALRAAAGAAATPPAQRLALCHALGALRDRDALPVMRTALAEAAEGDKPVLWRAMAECADEGILPELLDAIAAGPAGRRGAALDALATLAARLPTLERAAAVARALHERYPGEASRALLLDYAGLAEALPLLSQQLREGDLVAREAALALLERHPDAAVVDHCLAMAGDASPELAAAIIAMLGRRGATAARSYIEAQLRATDGALRKAAYEALPGVAPADCTALLAAAMATAPKDDLPAIRAVLIQQRNDDFAAQIAAAITSATPDGKAALMDILALRRAVAQRRAIFAQLDDSDTGVRRAAWKALTNLAQAADCEEIIGRVQAIDDAAERRAAQAALVNLARSNGDCAAKVLAALAAATGAARAAFLQLAPEIASAAALQAVQADLANDDAAVRDAAVRALAAWPTAEAMDALFALAAQPEPPTARVLALRGLSRLLGQDLGLAAADRLAKLGQLMALCQRADERKLVLAAAAALRQDAVLTGIVLPAFADPELADEAAAAAVKLVCARDAKDTGMTTSAAGEALKKVLAVSTNDALKEQALAQLARFPTQGVNVAMGKPVTTTCPQQGNHSPDKAVDGRITRDDSWFGAKWPSSLTVDLEQVEDVFSVRPIFYWDGRRLYTYTIEISEDNQTWRQVVDQSGNKRAADDKGVNHLLPAGCRARYVRLNILKNSVNEAVHLVELEVYSLTGKTPKAPGPNVLFKQPVQAGSPQEQDHSPDRVNDGRIGKNDGWHTDQCPTWITVDMQQEASIDTVRVIFYWDGRRSYAYTIDVSSDGESWQQVADNAANNTPADAQGIVHRFPARPARYVRLNITRGSGRYVHVVELEAYAAGKAPERFAAAEEPAVPAPPLPAADAEGFIPLFNGKDLAGWIGSVGGYGVNADGNLFCDPKKGGKLLTAWQFGDFVLRFEFKLAPGANNGLALRSPVEGNPAYDGMELQIIDDAGYQTVHGHKLQSWQHHGSIYGVVPAKVGAQKPAGEWNTQEVVAKGSQITVTLNGQVIVDADLSTITETADGQGLAKHPGLKRRRGHIGWLGHGALVEFRNIRIKPLAPYVDGPHNVPPEGFTALFNGRDLSGWKGLVANPEKRAQMSPDELATAQQAADEQMRQHWKVVGDMLEFDGKGKALCTAKDYADFEMFVDWRIGPRGDTGIYLRGSPQVQIWDHTQWKIGSGGLYNNKKNPSNPTHIMDNPIGEWNRFRIRMVGEKVSVWLNGELVVDEVVMENYWNRAKPIYPSGQIELQDHGNPIWFRNIYIKEL